MPLAILCPPPPQINPQHCIPTIVDGEVVLWESRAILQYFANKYDTTGLLYPADPELRARVDQKLFFDMGLFTRFRDYYLAKFNNMPVADPERYKNLEQQMQFLNTFLEDQEFVAGDNLTIADFAIMTSVTLCELASFPLGDYPNIVKWMEMCRETVPGIYADQESRDMLQEKVLKANAVAEEEEADVATA